MSPDDLLRPPDVGLLDRLVALSLRNRLLALIGLLLLVAIGLRAMLRLPIDAVPDVTNVQVQILTDAPALGPLEIERFITTPVEQGMGGLPHLEELRSISRFGLSAVTVVFAEGTDVWWARQAVGERIAEVRGEIPEGYGEPEMGPVSTGLGEIFQFEVRGDGTQSLMDLRDVLEWQVAPRLRAVPGVVEVNAFGGELRTFSVQITPESLAAHGLTLADVFEALARNNVNVGGGYLEKGREQMLVRGVALLDTVERVGAVVVATTPEGTPVTVASLGSVSYAPMLRQGAVTRNGRGEVVSGIAMMLLGANSRVVSAALGAEVEDLRRSLPPGVSLEVFYDRTELVDRTITTVAENLAEGALLVAFVLLLTLGNLRAALIAAAVIPLSLLVAFIGMDALGVSGNLMSLGAIDFGLMVDGAVVILENVLHTVRTERAQGRPVDARTILAAVRRVARPVAFSVGIIILVYLPILSFTGIEGKMFRPMAITVVLALTGSLVLTLTVVPVLAELLLRGAQDGDTALIRLAERLYRPLLALALRLRPLPALLALGVFVASAAITPFLGAEFVPTLEEGSLAIQILRPPSVSLEESLRQATLVEQTLLAAFPDEVADVVCKTGRAEIATDPMGVDLSDGLIALHPHEQWTKAHSKEELVEAMQAKLLDSVPGVNFSFSQPIELRVNELIEGVRSDVAIVVYGDDLAALAQAGEAIAGAVQRVPGAADVKVEQVAGLPMLRIEVDPEKIARLGLSAEDVLAGVEALGGKEVGTVIQGQRRYALQVRFPEEVRADTTRVARILVGRAGVRVPLGQVAAIVEEEGPLQVSHDGGRRRLTVEMNVRGRDVAGFVAEAERVIDAKLRLPPGYSLEWGGSFKNLAAASERLTVTVPLVLLLIFVLLQAMFGSTRLSLMVYANVPLAATGGILALLARGLPFSISAGVGFITLFGIAVLNGIVLVSHMRRLQEEGRSALDAAVTGAHDRLRTVVMTTLVAALGFLPMALATSAGAEVQRPLATVVIGGLVTSTALTLFVLPALYAWGMGRRG